MRGSVAKGFQACAHARLNSSALQLASSHQAVELTHARGASRCTVSRPGWGQPCCKGAPHRVGRFAEALCAGHCAPGRGSSIDRRWVAGRDLGGLSALPAATAVPVLVAEGVLGFAVAAAAAGVRLGVPGVRQAGAAVRPGAQGAGAEPSSWQGLAWVEALVVVGSWVARQQEPSSAGAGKGQELYLLLMDMAQEPKELRGLVEVLSLLASADLAALESRLLLELARCGSMATDWVEVEEVVERSDASCGCAPSFFHQSVGNT